MRIARLKIINRYTSKVLIDDLSFSLSEGDKVAVIGEEGDGKSTLLKALIGIQEEYMIVSGERDKVTNYGYLPQSIDPEWLKCSVEAFLLKDQISSDLDYNKYALSKPVNQYLDQFRLEVTLDQLMYTLSGGERTKVQLIKLLMCSPELYVLDEPTNDIDIETLEWLEQYIKELKTPVIFVSHDETLLSRVANRIIHIEQVKKKQLPRVTLYNGSYSSYIKQRLNEIEKQETSYQRDKFEYEKQMRIFKSIYQSVESKQNTISRGNPSKARLLAKKIKTLKAQERRFEEKERTEKPVMEEAIDIVFRNKTIPNIAWLDASLDKLMIQEKVLSLGVNIYIQGSEKVLIVGKNGVGKTTLLKELIKRIPNRFLVGYFPQNYDEVLKYEQSGITLLQEQTKQQEHIVRSYMGAARFTKEEMIQPISSYSGGQKAKIILLIQILNDVDIIVMDEPTRNLSPLSNPVFRTILSNFNGGILMVTHDRKMIEEVGTIVYELTKDGLLKRDDH